MTKIIKYLNNDHETRYKFRHYAGIDDKTGKQRYIKRSNFITKKQAQDELDKIVYELKTGQYYKQDKRMRFKDVYIDWLEQYKATVKITTFNLTKNNIDRYILPVFASYYMDKITLGDCQRLINHIFKKCPSVINLYASYLCRIFDYARRLGIIDENIALDIIKPRQADKQEKDNVYYTREELNKFLAVAKKQDLKKYTLFRLLAYSGMRIGELLALTWQDVSFVSKTIRVNKTIVSIQGQKPFIQSPKTKASNRLINMDGETIEILKTWKNYQKTYYGTTKDNKQPLFINRNNGYLQNRVVSEWNTNIAKQAGIKHIKLHGFRHTHATLLLKAGVPIKEVQYRLGHSKIDTTLNIYAHVVNDDKSKKIGQDFANYLKTDPNPDPQLKSVR